MLRSFLRKNSSLLKSSASQSNILNLSRGASSSKKVPRFTIPSRKLPDGPDTERKEDKHELFDMITNANTREFESNEGLSGEIEGDRFLTSVYTRETNYFGGGDTALDEAKRIAIKDPADSSVILFPGQGTHYVGMCGLEPDLDLFRTASELLGYDLLDLCSNGPIEKLGQTIYSQPAIFTSSLSALTQFKNRNETAVKNSVATAGYSIGEYAALVFSGVLSFEDALTLVRVRAEGMQISCDETKGAMATVLFGADSKLNFGLKVAKKWAIREGGISDPVCSISSHLFPHGKVIAGHLECIKFIQENSREFNLKKVILLPVSGAFHTPLMGPAASGVSKILQNIKINPPRIPVFSNVTGHRYRSDKELRKNLPQQIIRPVLWEQSLQNLFQRPKEMPYPKTYEVGPGSSLLGILKYVNAKAHLSAKSIQP